MKPGYSAGSEANNKKGQLTGQLTLEECMQHQGSLH